MDARRTLAANGTRRSAARSQGNCASSRAIASAVVGRSGARRGTASGGVVGSRARRSRWLRPKALPPRAPMRRSCSGDLLNSFLPGVRRVHSARNSEGHGLGGYFEQTGRGKLWSTHFLEPLVPDEQLDFGCCVSLFGGGLPRLPRYARPRWRVCEFDRQPSRAPGFIPI